MSGLLKEEQEEQKIKVSENELASAISKVKIIKRVILEFRRKQKLKNSSNFQDASTH